MSVCMHVCIYMGNDLKKYTYSSLILLSLPGKPHSQDTHLPPPRRWKNFPNFCLLRHSNSLDVYLFLNSEL